MSEQAWKNMYDPSFLYPIDTDSRAEKDDRAEKNACSGTKMVQHL